MVEFDNIIKLYKDPIILKNKLHDNYSSQFSDPNSYIWDTLLKTHYFSYKSFKKEFISFREFYIILFSSESLGINDLRIINRCQDILNLIPKIYDGDIICILNACCNTAILSGKYNLHFYRKQGINDNSRVYGEGLLKYQYIDSTKDIYIDQHINILSDSKICLSNGCYNPN